MGETYDRVDDGLRTWLLRQPMFFVGSAPDGPDGHVNVSPKGGAGTFFVLDEHRVAYLDLTGSGVETIAHARQNGRICLMFCSFDGPPRIIRLYGEARATARSEGAFDGMLDDLGSSLPDRVRDAARAVVEVAVSRISSSCGFVVPRMTYQEERDQLFVWIKDRKKKHGADALDTYVAVNNRQSIDGLPGIDAREPDAADVEDLSHVGRKL